MKNYLENAGEFVRNIQDKRIRTLVELVRGGYVKVIQNPKTYVLVQGNRIAIYETNGKFQEFERKWEGDRKFLPEKYKELGI